MTPFREFAPDRAGYDPTVMTYMENAIPLVNSYAPIRKLVTTSEPLPSEPRGYFVARRLDESFVTYAGTLTGLYRFNTASNAWDDVSGPDAPYSVPDNRTWSFAQFGSELIATQGGNVSQVIDINTGSNFERLGGSPPAANYNFKVGPFLVLLAMVGQEDGLVWSGRYNIREWRNGVLSSGGQEFFEGGQITGGVGGQNGGVILQTDAIRQMIFTPTSPYTFNFVRQDLNRDEQAGRGCIAPGSIVTVNNSAFFLDDNGFFRYTGGQITAIGDERVDRFIRRDAQDRRLIQGTADASSKSIYWSYRSIDVIEKQNSFETDKVLGYNWANDRWFLAKEMLTWLDSALTPGVTLDGLDSTGYNLDTLPYSLDSDVWKGGRPLIVGFDQQFRLGYFQGDNMQALFETADIEFNPTRRTGVEGLRVYTDSDNATGQIGTREGLNDPTKWRDPAARSPRRRVCWNKAEGRWMKGRVIIPEGATWGHLTGIDFENPQDAGE